ncbi:Gfo/Idh/MocA family oxidoreductase [Microbacterium sp. STN6]|uniref:Gfo/Idh/MocA family protein n=1 Tax=Microbacterium sp. STN6 TaxID=2995588 RepID=UPI0022609D90|nr:Gfo/Idh/MocA family oxidoreductase [Microbacterium sp. STN6]MCX7520753.1 Gfo/Idh/MocA family oxidoreductase [Microbacterium sp. STN6]
MSSEVPAADGRRADARTPLGVGIVGGGFMAAVHSRAARASRARLAGIVASSPERSRQAADELGVERGFDSLDAMLADDAIDVVHVCTPNALHAEQAEAIIASGRHIVCEKPLATNVTDAARLVAAAASASLTATVPFVYRFHPLVREARARVRAGEFGRLLTIHGSYLQDWLLSASDDNWRVDAERGGRSRAFADIGSHLVDLTEFVTGDRVTRVAATRRTFFDERGAATDASRRVTTEDAIAITLETAGGALGTLLVSQVAAGRKNRLHLEIGGAEESIAFDGEQPETIWLGRRAGSQVIPRDADQLHPDAARLCRVPAGHPQGYQDAFNGFVADTYDAIGGAAPDGLPRFEDGLRAARITDAVMDAADAGQWVTVEAG